MRNLAMAADNSFQAQRRWTDGDLPITLPWRSSLWRYIVPALWVVGCLFWIWVVTIQIPDHGIVLYALLFIGMPLVLALAAAWWVRQLLHRRTTASFIVSDDSVEWQFESESDMDLMADCTPFTLVGKRDYDMQIEWDIADSNEADAGRWPRWMTSLIRLKWIKSGRVLCGRDVGLDREDLESLCKLLNQLRDRATAHR